MDNNHGVRWLMHSRGQRGFTLLELVVVLVIVGLVSALVVPKLAGPMSNLDLRTASQKISASLRYVRSHAAAEKTTYVALFDFENNRLAMITPPVTTGDFRIDSRAAFERAAALTDSETDRPHGLKTYDLPDGVKLAEGVSRDGSVRSGLFPIFFFPTGGSSGGEVTVANERGSRYTVTVDVITGTVQLSEVTG